MRRSHSTTKFSAAFIEAKKAMGPATRNKVNPHFRSSYVDLAGVVEACESALLESGIAVWQTIEINATSAKIKDGNESLDRGERDVMVTTLEHVSGEWIEGDYPVKPTKDDPQGYASAVTYARRYALMAICGLAPEDDDGNAASGKPSNVVDMPRNGNGSPPKTNGDAAKAITPATMTKLMVSLKQMQLMDGDAMRTWCADKIGREIASRKDLTEAEAVTLLALAAKATAVTK